ncbi:5'/3'-nucleotidase SurE [Puniceicoccales bacterium CK1056]|uniref:5'-nucleotidase n=1 Tax=Oceanipulchritudo coccoides TaxID=2706888 RepID=A0A6B2M6M2_9BACT|nr:5'/3'-nucleotidase SurE [Oceanipulchritudo coccoides]NDV63455.1 5'/3'-nucleotidase SurE [Oceanipulchritudo coccoides]
MGISFANFRPMVLKKAQLSYTRDHMPKHILITNDDGIESGFLHAIARALSEHFEITIAAPAKEQSWIGRAVSRRRPVRVEEHPELPWKAWTIDGTPTDCVNIALGNLLPERPDAVVSGINIGYNTSIPLIYCSGTVAGALEGAFWGLPSFAISQEIPDNIFEHVTHSKGALPDDWQSLLDASAQHASELIGKILSNGAGGADAVVHNLNYPSRPKKPFNTVRTVPAPLQELPFYKRDDSGDYSFNFQHGITVDAKQKTDREALIEGEVSHSILNFSALGRDLNH